MNESSTDESVSQHVRLVTEQESELELARTRVANGAAFLDSHHEVVPSNWRELVNVDELVITDGTACVIGQIGGYVTGGDRHWNWGFDEFGTVDGAWDGRYIISQLDLGFSIGIYDYPDMERRRRAFENLQTAWVEYLTQTQAPKETA